MPTAHALQNLSHLGRKLSHLGIHLCRCSPIANLMAWYSGPRGCASTRDVLLLDAVRLCAGMPAQFTVRRDDDEVRVEDGLKFAPVLHSTPNQTIVAERGTNLGRQVHGLSYKAV
ncbi:unnamed protein product [Prunus armeniaca]